MQDSDMLSFFFPFSFPNDFKTNNSNYIQT